MKLTKRSRIVTTLGAIALVIGGVPLYQSAHQYYSDQALIAAIRRQDRDAVVALLAFGANPNVTIPMGSPPSLRTQFLRLFRRSESDAHPVSAWVAPALCAGFRQVNGTDVIEIAPEDLSITEALLKHGAKVDATDDHDQTALGWAICLDRMQTVRLLLNHGADLRHTILFTHPLFIAKSGKRERVLFYDRFRESPLEVALDQPLYGSHGSPGPDPNLVRLLVQHGAADDPQDRGGLTLLMIAALKGDQTGVQTLLSQGAKVNAKVRGYTVLDLLKACEPRAGDAEIERLLEKAGGKE